MDSESFEESAQRLRSRAEDLAGQLTIAQGKNQRYVVELQERSETIQCVTMRGFSLLVCHELQFPGD